MKEPAKPARHGDPEMLYEDELRLNVGHLPSEQNTYNSQASVGFPQELDIVDLYFISTRKR